MVKVTVLYEFRGDPEQFDAYYFGTHVPLARELPDVESVEVVRTGPGPDGSEPPYHLITSLSYKDAATMGASLGSEKGQTVAADVENFPGDWSSTVVIGEVA